MSTSGTMLALESFPLQGGESRPRVLLSPLVESVIDECLSRYVEDYQAAGDYIRSTVLQLYKSADIWAETEDALEVRGKIDATAATCLALADSIESQRQTATGTLYFLSQRTAETFSFGEDDWDAYENEMRFLDEQTETKPENLNLEIITTEGKTTETEIAEYSWKEEIVMDEILTPDEIVWSDGKGLQEPWEYEVPRWDDQLPVSVDDIRWKDQQVEDGVEDLSEENVVIRFNGEKIPAIPLGQIALYHGKRRAYKVTDARGMAEVVKLTAETPKLFASWLGSKLVMFGLTMQDNGLSKADVNHDVAERVLTDWEATSSARHGRRPDTGLRNASRIKNTSFKPVGGSNIKAISSSPEGVNS